MSTREKILSTVLICMVLVFGIDYVQSQHQRTGPGPNQYLDYTQLADQALTSPVTTAWYNVGGYNDMALFLKYVDANSSISELMYICQESPDQTNIYELKSISVASGTLTVDGASWVQSMSGSENWRIRLTPNTKYTRCTFTVTAGTATGVDLLTIDARAMAY